MSPKQRALLSDLSAILLEFYKGRTAGAPSDSEQLGEEETAPLDPISRWISSTPGAVDLLVQLSKQPATTTTQPSTQVDNALRDVVAPSTPPRAISGPSTAEASARPSDTGQQQQSGLPLPLAKPPTGKRMIRPPMMSVPEHAPASVSPEESCDATVGGGDLSNQALLDDLVNELILLLANTPWIKDFIRQQQVTQGSLISAANGDLTLVTGTDILVYTGSVEKMASLLQIQQQQQGTSSGHEVPQPHTSLASQQQQFVLPSPLLPSQSPFRQGGSMQTANGGGGMLASPLPPQQTIQQAMRLQAAQAAAAAAAGGGGGASPGMLQTGLARPVPGPGQAQPKRGVLNMETLSTSPQLAALVKEVSFLLLTAGGPSRQLLLSELGTRISAQSRMFLKLNRTRLGQLLLRFPKDFLIEGQKASGKVTLIQPEVIQCPSTPVPLEKDIIGENVVSTGDSAFADEAPPGMSNNDAQSNVFSQAASGNYYTGNQTQADDGLTLSSRSGSRLMLRVLEGSSSSNKGANDNYLYMAPQQLVSSPLPLVSPGTALGLTPFSALPRSMAEGVLQTPALRRDPSTFPQQQEEEQQQPECVLSAVQGWASDSGFPSGSYRVLDDPEASCDAVAEALMFSVNAVGAELTALKDTTFAPWQVVGASRLVPYFCPTCVEPCGTICVYFNEAADVHRSSCERRPPPGVAILSRGDKAACCMWHMVNLGSFGDYGSPHRNLQLLLGLLPTLYESLNLVSDAVQQIGIDSISIGNAAHEPEGMFTNTVVLYRKLFPERAHLDKGLLRTILRLLPMDSSLCDFGGLDGRYALWLNDTGLVEAYAVDGIRGISELTDGAVMEADLTTPNLTLWRQFDCVLSLEVAEHIPKQHERVFLENLARHAEECLIVSWALPETLGEGHVNSMGEEESHRRVVEVTGFVRDDTATKMLRESAEIEWIASTVAMYVKPNSRSDV
ncbi:hypothetical protein FOZ60_013483 [Perkinsus olseni]|uniref:Uncharacterized protein n=1 Tax=Perkinsus olseni TaxID=32597 RepID=A0A7J6N945_PEROL|nr:hypothetical protein FOZ60_013483 [Perkinsus olseni]